MTKRGKYTKNQRRKIRLNTPEEEEAINKAALSDPDNLPMTDEELGSLRPASEVMPDIVKAYIRRNKETPPDIQEKD